MSRRASRADACQQFLTLRAPKQVDETPKAKKVGSLHRGKNETNI